VLKKIAQLSDFVWILTGWSVCCRVSNYFLLICSLINHTNATISAFLRLFHVLYVII